LIHLKNNRAALTTESINKIIELTLQQHPKFLMNPSKANDITRLSINEFALYPAAKRGPLTLDGFNKLLLKIQELAEKYPDNLHFLLATIPVKITRKVNAKMTDVVENFGVYVESGQETRVRPFAKAYSSNIDPVYPNTVLLDFRDKTLNFESIADFSTMNTNKGSMTIAYGGIFQTKTLSGKSIRIAIDICIDYYKKVAKRRTIYQLDTSARTGVVIESTVASEQLTSNTYNKILLDSQITNTITQIDPAFSINGSIHLGNQVVSFVDRMLLANPKFGSKIVIDVYDPIILKPHTKKLQARINKINAFALRLSALHIYRDQRPTEIDEVSHEINRHIIKPVLDELINLKQYPDIQTELSNLPTNHAKIIKILKKINLKKKNDALSLYVENSIQLLKIEKRATQAIKEQLIETAPVKQCPPKLATPPDTDIDKLQTSKAERVDVNPVFSFATSGLNSLFSTVKKSIGSPDAQTPLPDQTEHKTAASSTFTEPLSFQEALVVLQYAAHYSPFTLPWNRVVNLTSTDINRLNENLDALDNLDLQFEKLKDKYAYRFDVNTQQFSEMHMLLKNTRSEIQQMLTRKTKTDASFRQLQNRIVTLQEKMPNTNAEIQQARHVRRSR
jgi:hypothetical protein